MWRGRWLAEGALCEGSRRSETGTAHFLIDEVSGQLDLLRKPPDGEHPQAGVRAGRRVPLKLHVRSRMLVYAFDVLTPFAYDEAALICRHCVGYLLDATRVSHAPVTAATASSSGYRQASEAISFLGCKNKLVDDMCCMLASLWGSHDLCSSLWTNTIIWFELNSHTGIILDLFDHFPISSYYNPNCKPRHRHLYTASSHSGAEITAYTSKISLVFFSDDL